ncbi:NADase-type glycan-binding domain-containing protein [Nocardioides allogilvus]|uniref:NADase-type glycan-binding domain-containing protein n=1 Tax=Nocardioides allogilvus TaxID=2072017 RepID=UPI0013003A7C|nr:hypothetical protein [Nocardioides allogilvus]
MTTCARCGHDLGVGRFCLNCGHPVGEPVPAGEPLRVSPDDAPLPDQAATEVPPWAPWAIGALLVVILFSVLSSCLGGDDEDEPRGERATRTSEKTAPRAVDLTSTLEVTAPPAAPATTDLDGRLVDYDPSHMLDATPSTAWRTAGDASGETISFTLPEPSTIRRVGILNGYAKQVPSGSGLVDWYPHNRRITAVEWAFDDGTVVRQDLREKAKLQRLTIDPVTTSTVQLRLLAVTPPGAGVLGRDYTAISDVLVAGTPAA